MSRLKSRFEALREQGRTALIPYVTAGDPNPQVTVPLMHAMVEAGADIIELGVPFSDPMADGPVIQRASERALEHHTSLRDVLGMVRSFREQNQETPVVLMGYLNPIEVMGYGAFVQAAAEAGVDGVLTVDIPPEEAEDVLPLFKAQGLDAIFLLAPTTTGERIRRVCASASGFVYYVSLKGVTGASHLNLDEVAAKLSEIRIATDLPIGVGFGIKDAETAAKMSKLADAVVVGSALVNQVEALADRPEAIAPTLAGILAGMRAAMDKAI
jgi:tryptophan synthase alpha chain